jgi:hypothetical protein
VKAAVAAGMRAFGYAGAPHTDGEALEAHGATVVPPHALAAALLERMSRAAIHGWLLLLPAFALLALFTHWPIVGTIWDSFHATPRAAARARGSASRTTR